MSEREFEVSISHVEKVAEGVLRFSLTHPQGQELPSWEAGAHIDVGLSINGKGTTRQYSLCSRPSNRSAWQIAVRLSEEGRGGSAHIHQAFAVGNRIKVSQPRNHFPLIAARRYLFIAGGIGITPILPMIAEVHSEGCEWRLVYCGRKAASMPFTQALSAQYGDHVVFHESAKDGRLDLATVIAWADADTVIYSCGPASMLDGIDTQCASWAPGRVHYERFAAQEVEAENGAFEVEFARSGITVEVPADKTILEVAEENGIDIDSSCQEGVCGACETRILSGSPDHRDTVLSAKERAAGRSMMVCVSRCCSSRLVLDA
ncbi:ferredoxin [Pseudomonas putida]|uniref:PDR/VanB family oxidoreductase n=1 Tax=Pseudomonas putida TaxID=303 RepID=UPI0007B6CC45|nr:PDR/VanB family oxidoreductase [Pseudomonas putida]ANC04041.1 ferredoxin [Pseudomonas putida]